MRNVPLDDRLPHGVGAVVGVLGALMGVGGGFIMVPAMIYLLGMPGKVVIGTSLFQICFVSAFTTFMQSTTNQTVDVILGLSLMIAIGPENFDRFLAGGAAMDRHFREAPADAARGARDKNSLFHEIDKCREASYLTRDDPSCQKRQSARRRTAVRRLARTGRRACWLRQSRRG